MLVSFNEITTITYNNGDFPKLKSLSITHNKLNDWQSIDTLNQFPEFESIRYNNNQFISQYGPSISRNLVIAKIAKLTVINGSDVRFAL